MTQQVAIGKAALAPDQTPESPVFEAVADVGYRRLAIVNEIARPRKG